MKCFSRCDVTSQPAFLAMAQDHLRIDNKELRAGLTMCLESIESSKKLASTGHDALMVQPALSDGDQRRTLKQQVPKQQDADPSQGGPSPTSVSGDEQQSEAQSLPITDQEQRAREQEVALPATEDQSQTGPANRDTDVAARLLELGRRIGCIIL